MLKRLSKSASRKKLPDTSLTKDHLEYRSVLIAPLTSPHLQSPFIHIPPHPHSFLISLLIRFLLGVACCNLRLFELKDSKRAPSRSSQPNGTKKQNKLLQNTERAHTISLYLSPMFLSISLSHTQHSNNNWPFPLSLSPNILPSSWECSLLNNMIVYM